MNNSRIIKKLALLSIFSILIISLSLPIASAQVSDFDFRDVWHGVAIVLAPGGYAGYYSMELVQARLLVFILLTIILVPTLAKVPLFSGGGGGYF